MESVRIERCVLLFLLAIVLVSTVAFGGEEISAIEFELPGAMFRETPPNLSRISNLEPLRTKSRPAFYAPAGVTNVARGKPVASTDDMPIVGELEMITDGDKRGSDGSFVELGPFLQHVTVDLEGEYELYAIVVWHYHRQPRVFYDVVVQIADDADFVENVRTVYNNDMDNSAGLGVGKEMHYVETNQGRLIDAKGQRGRYVRLYSQGNQANDLNQYIEVEVWGRAVKEAVPECEQLVIDYPRFMIVGEPWHLQKYHDFSWHDSYYRQFMVPVGTRNIALGRKVTSSDMRPVIGSLDMIVDDNKEGGYSNYVEIEPGLQHVTIDLGEVYELYAICIWRNHHYCNVYDDVIVQISCDAEFVGGVTLFNNDRDGSAGLGVGVDRPYLEDYRGKMISAAGLCGRYVRVWSNGKRASEFNGYVEIGVYGKECDERAGAWRLIPLNFELPVEPRVSIAYNWKGPPNIERPSSKGRETFFAPVGTRKISPGRPVTGGRKEAPMAGRLQMITDGDKDCGKENYVELGPFAQHVTIDLETEYEISAILLWHYMRDQSPRVYFDVVVQVSSDADFVEGVHTVFNNDTDNDLNHYTEVEVFGF